MIRIKLSSEPSWLIIAPGVRVLTRPGGTAVIVAAGADMGGEAGRMPFAKAVARAAILEWEGVVGEDDKALEVTPETVNAAMDNWTFYREFERQYVNLALIVSTEGNA